MQKMWNAFVAINVVISAKCVENYRMIAKVVCLIHPLELRETDLQDLIEDDQLSKKDDLYGTVMEARQSLEPI